MDPVDTETLPADFTDYETQDDAPIEAAAERPTREDWLRQAN